MNEPTAAKLYPAALRAIADAIAESDTRFHIPLICACSHQGKHYHFDAEKWLRAKADRIEAAATERTPS